MFQDLIKKKVRGMPEGEHGQGILIIQIDIFTSFLDGAESEDSTIQNRAFPSQRYSYWRNYFCSPLGEGTCALRKPQESSGKPGQCVVLNQTNQRPVLSEMRN